MASCQSLLLATLSILACSPTSSAATPAVRPSPEDARGNANRVFNAVHSAMRQWGSSIHHNGMSFFPATIPAGVWLYHGGHQEDAVTGMEWLAFEIEHAESFARPAPAPPPSDGPRQPPQTLLRRRMTSPNQSPLVQQQQQDFDDDDDDDNDRRSSSSSRPRRPFRDGYLHTYRVTRPQRMLYIDGMSGAKSPLGTLDSQDELLRNRTGSGGFDEWPRAGALCDLARAWELDGVVRMEAGFEVIKCDFADGSLDLVSVARRPPWRPAYGDDDDGGDGDDDDDDGWALDQMEYLRAVSQRYWGITASRVALDQSRMVSALFYPVNLTNPEAVSNPALPRMVSVPWEELDAIKNDVAEAMAAASWQGTTTSGLDWQGVTDMVVSRYADRLRFIAERTTTLEDVRADVNGLLDTFINYATAAAADDAQTPDLVAARRRCSRHYLDPVRSAVTTWQDELIRIALEAVTSRICTDLFAVRAILSESGATGGEGERGGVDHQLARARARVRGLMTWLDWAEWRKCGACEPSQVCFVAVWPYGDAEDHFSPSCLNKTQLEGRHGYWRFDRRGRG
ncbi:uncharacterized protein E0L32_002794 [Thyridium curvatum]|uniref:Uncharacterized protein n=1 Tax=Thyridium curvatum TaxID=1093900 RepID=A0A507B587_9PEZI|nr:uncharacterized protein E0L32_002794 [Thyridium curvatum]TPX18285.1 hypothetical protein E0L32_002794 [Thyridium curvatum]